jgi:hypothetical protein
VEVIRTLFRIGVLVSGAIALWAAVFGKEGEFRWGKHGLGPRMKPQWAGRIFFGFIGFVLLYFGIFKFPE